VFHLHRDCSKDTDRIVPNLSTLRLTHDAVSLVHDKDRHVTWDRNEAKIKYT